MLEILIIFVDLFFALLMLAAIGYMKTNGSAVLAGLISVLMTLNAAYIVFT